LESCLKMINKSTDFN